MHRESRIGFKYVSLVAAALVLLLGLGVPGPVEAGITWIARAIDPALIANLRRDDHRLEVTLFGEQPPILTERLKREHRVSLSDEEIRKEVLAWVEKHKAEVGDTELELDKAWHGIHYLLTGSADPDGTAGSKAILGGEDIGPNRGYGPAQLLMPDEVREIAKLLTSLSEDDLRRRYSVSDMSRLEIYPRVWERECDGALRWLLSYYPELVRFYQRAAERGRAVILALT